MNKKIFPVSALVCMLLSATLIASGVWAAGTNSKKADQKPPITITKDVGKAMSHRAEQVRQELEQRAASLFHREPLRFNWGTVTYLYDFLLGLPAKLPALTQKIIEHSRTLGIAGSLTVLIFFIALIYSLLGQKRIMAGMQSRLAPLKRYIPDSLYHPILPVIHVVVASLFPLLLLAAYALIDALIAYNAAWFLLIGRLLIIWAVAALVLRLLHELLTDGLIPTSGRHGRSLYGLSRWIVLYSVLGIALYQAAEVFHLRADVLALIRFAVSLSISLVLFLLLLKKKALLSLLPDLPRPSYQKFCRMLERYYFPLVFFCLVLALLWSVGFQSLGRIVLGKIWSSGAAYLIIMLLYNTAINALERWYARSDKSNEAAQLVFRSCKSLLRYGATILTILIVLNLLGLLVLVEHGLSFPVFRLGDTFVTPWTIIKAALILAAFAFTSRLIQAYLDYRIYPAVGVEPGLGYALNTFLKYLMLAIGLLVALNVIGLDLRFLLVFAGAIGIGIGLGLQNMTANVISGFSLIFGGKLRKGDWIEAGGTMGVVTDIFLRATKVRTRDNIEYLIPNSTFISGTLINYSLDSPLIRIHVPVGVSYDADPRQVEQILLDVARQEPSISKGKPPVVRFTEFGDNSLNFLLMVWIDVRTTPRRRVRSALYFTIFEEFKKAGIEIPFPQRDIHIRSTVERALPGKPVGESP
jgi:small-conductance mechanosensitive channel